MLCSISVIICCYNSALRLPDTLSYIANQRVTNIDWELIIVDNNSTDITSEVAQQEWAKLGNVAPMTVIFESQPGLSHARIAGIKQARYELLLFCDDDNWLEGDYLSQASQIMKYDSKIGVLGGKNTAVSSIELPFWFENFEQGYACGPQALVDGEVPNDRLYVTGAGMVLRKQIFQDLKKINFKSTLTDRKGEELSSGGDTELCFMAAMLGYKIVYSSKLKLFHYMEPRRLTWAYFLKLSKGHAKSYYKLAFYKRVYEGHFVNNNWLKASATWIAELLSRKGVLMFYHYFVKGDQAVGDKFNFEMVSKAEMFKAHLCLRGEYRSFINELYRLRNEAIKLEHN